jgi:hypothetical protein
MSEASELRAKAAQPAGRRTPQWVVVTIAVFFGLFYAYDAWEAVGNLVGLNLAAQGLDTQLSGGGWALLLAGVLLPVLVYVLAFWLGRGRTAVARAVLFLVGLCLVAVLTLDIFTFGLGALLI